MLFFVTLLLEQKSKSNLHYTRGITPKRVTSGGAHLRGLAPGLQLRRNVAAVASRWRHCRFERSGIEPQTSRTESVRLATKTNGFKYLNCFFFFRWKHEEVGKLQLHS